MKEIKYKGVLFEPISPFFVGVYSTLISIVQGLSLGGIFYILSEEYSSYNELFNYAILVKIVICFLVICLIWHRYVSHFQYLAWQLTIWDAIIPLGFGIIQSFLIISLKHNVPIANLNLALAAIFFWGFFAYLNVYRKHYTDKSNKIFYEHYSAITDSKKFVPILFEEIHKFNGFFCREMVIVFFFFFSLFIIFSIPIHIPNKESWWLSTIGVSSMIIFFRLYKYDLPHKLRTSPKLKPFGYFKKAEFMNKSNLFDKDDQEDNLKEVNKNIPFEDTKPVEG